MGFDVDKRVRFAFEATSELPTVTAQLEEILRLITEQTARSAAWSAAFKGAKTEIVTSLSNINDSTKATTTAVETSSKNQVNALDNVKKGVDDISKSYTNVRNLIATAFTLNEIRQFGTEIIDAKSKIDIFKGGLGQMLESQSAVAELYPKIVKLAQTTPFQVEDLFTVTLRLKAMGVETRDLIPTLEVLGNTAAVIGTDKLPLIAKAYTDVMNKGRLMKQELNQFAENGVPLYDLLAESMHKTRAEVVQLADDHEITFAQVKKALQDASSEGGRYYNLMQVQAQTLGGRVNQLKDVFFLAKAGIGDFFENTISDGITKISELTSRLAGSQPAIERTINGLKAAGSAMATYVVATNAANVATLAKNTYTAAATLAQGTYNLVMITAAGSTDTFTAAQIRSAAAARASWAAMGASPLTALIAVVGLAATAYYAYEASISDANLAQEKLNGRIAEATAPLRIAKDEFNSLAKEVLNGKLSAEQQYIAFDKLKKQYPELLKETNDLATAEKWLKLNGIDVNTQLEYRKMKFDELKEKFPLQMKGIEDYAEAERKLGPLIRAVNNDLLIRIKLMENEVRTEVNNEAAMTAIKEKIRLEGELAKAKSATTVVGMDGQVIELKSVALINQGIQARIDGLDKVIKQSQQFNQNIAYQSERLTKQVNKDWDMQAAAAEAAAKREAAAAAAAAKAAEDAENKKKAKAILTAAEIDEIRKRVNANATQDLDDRMKLIDKEANVQIAAINKMKISRAEAEKEIEKVLQTAQDTKTQIYRDEYAVLSQFKELDKKETFNDLTDTNLFHAAKLRERERNEREYYNAVDKMRKEADENFEKAADITAKTTAKSLNEAFKQVGGGLGNIYGFLTGEATKGFKQINDDLKAEMATMQIAVDMAKSIWGENSKQYQGARLEQSKLSVELAKSTADLNKATLQQGIGVAQAIEENLKKVVDIVIKFKQEATKLALEVLETVQRVTDAFYKMYADTYKQRIDDTLKDEKLSYAERIAAAEKFQKRMNEVLDQNDLIQQTTEKSKQLVQISNDSFEQIGSGIKKLFNPLTATQGLVEIFNSIRNHNARVEQMNRELDLQKAQQNVARIQNEIDTETQIFNAKMQFYADDLDAFTKLNNDKIDELEKAKDAQLKILEAELDDSKNIYDTAAYYAKKIRDEDTATRKTKYETDLQASKDAFDAYKTQYADDVAAVKDAYSQQIEALREKQDIEKQLIQEFYDQKAAMLEQSTADETSKVEILDRVRLEALQRYEAAETKKLQDARDRIVSTLKDEGEKNAVIEEYNRKILAVHNEVEEAKLDKTKGVKIATTQLNNEEKDEAIRLKNEEKTELAALDDKYQEQFKKLANERDAKLNEMDIANRKREAEQKEELRQISQKYDDDIRKIDAKYDADLAILKQAQTDRDIITNAKILKLETDTAAAIAKLKQDIANKDAETKTQMLNAQNEYAKFMRDQNGQLFEAQKAMAVAELNVAKAQIAAKKGLFGYTKAQREAMNEIDAQIANIMGTANPYYAGNIQDSIPQDFKDLAQKYVSGGNVVEDYNSKPDVYANGPNQLDANGNEKPMGKVTGADGKEYLYYEVNQIDGQSQPWYRTKRAFFKGSTYLDLLGHYPAGRDMIPAMLAGQELINLDGGERIMPKSMNKLIGGAKTSNEELTTAWLTYAEIKKRNPLIDYSSIAAQMNVDYSAMSRNFLRNKESDQEDKHLKELRELNRSIRNGLVKINIEPDHVEWERYLDDKKETYHTKIGN